MGKEREREASNQTFQCFGKKRVFHASAVGRIKLFVSWAMIMSTLDKAIPNAQIPFGITRHSANELLPMGLVPLTRLRWLFLHTEGEEQNRLMPISCHVDRTIRLDPGALQRTYLPSHLKRLMHGCGFGSTRPVIIPAQTV